MTCSIAHCDRVIFAKGLCGRHYQAARKYGDPLMVKQKQHHGKTVQERFYLYTKRTPECWLWVGFKDPNGYGRLNIAGIPMLASRLSYQLHFGDIPDGKYVCHKCDNPSCVNPEHLFLGTQRDNVADMISKGRARKRGMPGTEHPASKLDEDAVREIRRSDQTDAELAERFQVSRPTIHAVRKRKTWTHIT